LLFFKKPGRSPFSQVGESLDLLQVTAKERMSFRKDTIKATGGILKSKRENWFSVIFFLLLSKNGCCHKGKPRTVLRNSRATMLQGDRLDPSLWLFAG